MQDLGRFLAYKSWADKVFADHISTLPTSLLTQDQPIIFGSVIGTLQHVYLMDFVWKSHLLGQDHGLDSRNPSDLPDLSALAAQQADIDQWFIDYAATLPDNDLQAPVSFTFIGGGDGTMTRQDILLHVVNHATYHRGHAADMLYQMGHKPPATDYPIYVTRYSS